MCEFFSCIATREGDLFFCEDDSHEAVIQRAKLRDGDQHVRHWVRVEVQPQGEGWGPVRVDETTVPAWWTEDAAAWEGKVLDLAGRVRPAWAAYGAACDQAWVAYDAACDQAWAAYDAACDQAWAAYDAACDQAGAAYKAACDQARVAYINQLSTIAGYQPEVS